MHDKRLRASITQGLLSQLDSKTLALGFDNDHGFEGDDAEIFPMADLKSRTLAVTLPIVLPPPVKPPRSETAGSSAGQVAPAEPRDRR